MLNIEQHSGIQMIANPHTTSGFTPSFLSKRETEPVRHLHMSLDDYAATPLVELSAAAHKGTRELVKLVAERLSALPPIAVYEPDYVPKAPRADASAPLDIQHEDGVWIVEGPWLQRLMANVNFTDYESRMWFDKALRDAGVFQRLEDLGIQDGDTVSMDGFEFEYQK